MKHTQNKKGFVAPCHVRCRVPAARCAGMKRLLRSLLWLLPPAKVHVLLNIPFFCPLLPPPSNFTFFWFVSASCLLDYTENAAQESRKFAARLDLSREKLMVHLCLVLASESCPHVSSR